MAQQNRDDRMKGSEQKKNEPQQPPRDHERVKGSESMDQPSSKPGTQGQPRRMPLPD